MSPSEVTRYLSRCLRPAANSLNFRDAGGQEGERKREQERDGEREGERESRGVKRWASTRPGWRGSMKANMRVLRTSLLVAPSSGSQAAR